MECHVASLSSSDSDPARERARLARRTEPLGDAVADDVRFLVPERGADGWFLWRSAPQRDPLAMQLTQRSSRKSRSVFSESVAMRPKSDGSPLTIRNSHSERWGCLCSFS